MHEVLFSYCGKYACPHCPLKPYIPECGRGWHIALDGNIKQQEAALLIFVGAKTMQEAMKDEE